MLLRDAHSISPINFERLINLGLLELKNRISVAEQYFHEAQRCNPESIEANLGLEHSAKLNEDQDTSSAHYAGIHNKLGISCSRNQEFELSIDHYKKALPLVTNPLKQAQFTSTLPFVISKTMMLKWVGST